MRTLIIGNRDLTFNSKILQYPKTLWDVNVIQPYHGTLTASKSTAAAGETVTLSSTADTNFQFICYTVNGVEIQGNSFVMPFGDVTVQVKLAWVDPLGIKPWTVRVWTWNQAGGSFTSTITKPNVSFAITSQYYDPSYGSYVDQVDVTLEDPDWSNLFKNTFYGYAIIGSNTSGVTNMSGMLSTTYEHQNSHQYWQEVNNLDTCSVTNMDNFLYNEPPRWSLSPNATVTPVFTDLSNVTSCKNAFRNQIYMGQLTAWYKPGSITNLYNQLNNGKNENHERCFYRCAENGCSSAIAEVAAIPSDWK